MRFSSARRISAGFTRTACRSGARLASIAVSHRDHHGRHRQRVARLHAEQDARHERRPGRGRARCRARGRSRPARPRGPAPAPPTCDRCAPRARRMPNSRRALTRLRSRSRRSMPTPASRRASESRRRLTRPGREPRQGERLRRSGRPTVSAKYDAAPTGSTDASAALTRPRERAAGELIVSDHGVHAALVDLRLRRIRASAATRLLGPRWLTRADDADRPFASSSCRPVSRTGRRWPIAAALVRPPPPRAARRRRSATGWEDGAIVRREEPPCAASLTPIVSK